MTSVAALKPDPPSHYSLLTQSYQLSSCILLQSLSKGCTLNLCLCIFLTGREKETDGGHLPSGPARPQPGVPLAGRGMIDGALSRVYRGGCLCLILSS